MAERRRQRKRPESTVNNEDLDKPDKVEFEIAKYLRSNLPPKQTTLLGHKVDYFIASRAIDLLMTSKWSQTNKLNDEVMFPTRESVINFMNIMLRHKFFHRAKTIIVKKEIKIKQDNNDSTDECIKNETKKSQTKKHTNNNKEHQQQSTSTTTTTEKISKKEKKKVKLDMHMEQIFIDANEPYVWIYDYIPMRTWLIGGGLVISAIAICLFPLWPRTVRNYVYYLSIAVAVFLFFIITLALLKIVVFSIVWTLTFGRHHLWILPNLTEDVGFFESFWPLYKHEYKYKKKNSNDNKHEQNNDDEDDDNDNDNDDNNDDDNDKMKRKNRKKCKLSIKQKSDNNESNDTNDSNNSNNDSDDDDDENCYEENNDDNDNNDNDLNNKNKKLKKNKNVKTTKATTTNGFEILDSNECEEN